MYWRLSLGERIAARFALHPDVLAAAVTGSVARGHADRFWDIELFTVWREPPPRADRVALLAEVGTDFVVGSGDDESWWDDLYIGRAAPSRVNSGALVEITGMTVEAVDTTIDDVVLRHGADLDKQSLIHAIRNAHVVSGHELLDDWVRRTDDYPLELAVAMVRAHGQIDNFDDWRRMLERSNLIAVYGQFSAVATKLFCVLHAVNRRYWFKLKWIDAVIEELETKPANLRERLGGVFTSSVPEAAEALRALVEDVYDITALELPEAPVDRLREIFRWSRTEWEDAPPGI